MAGSESLSPLYPFFSFPAHPIYPEQVLSGVVWTPVALSGPSSLPALLQQSWPHDHHECWGPSQIRTSGIISA
jgi:hypothetical protein